jgi:hypothetical protein
MVGDKLLFYLMVYRAWVRATYTTGVSLTMEKKGDMLQASGNTSLYGSDK